MCPYHCEQLTQYSNVPQLELQGEGGGVGSVTAGNRPSTAQAPSATGRLGVWIPALKSPHKVGLFCPSSSSLLTLVWSAVCDDARSQKSAYSRSLLHIY